MDREIIFLIEEADEGGYIARALGQSIFTEAETIEDLHVQVKDSVTVHYTTSDKPSLIRLRFLKDEIISA